MNVFAVWLGACLKKCVALFASKGAGTFLQTKSNKEKNNSDKGELNINVSYRTNDFGYKKKEIKKSSISTALFSCHQDLLSSLITFDTAISTLDTENNKRANARIRLAIC